MVQQRLTHNQPRANKTDAGNGSKAICRVSNVLRSPSPDPKRSLQKMRCYLHILPCVPERDQAPDFEASVRTCVANAPGIVSVTSVAAHPRGGFEVVADRAVHLPDDFGDYFDQSELMLVI